MQNTKWSVHKNKTIRYDTYMRYINKKDTEAERTSVSNKYKCGSTHISGIFPS